MHSYLFYPLAETENGPEMAKKLEHQDGRVPTQPLLWLEWGLIGTPSKGNSFKQALVRSNYELVSDRETELTRHCGRRGCMGPSTPRMLSPAKAFATLRMTDLGA